MRWKVCLRNSGVSGRSTGFDMHLTTAGSDKSLKLRQESDTAFHGGVLTELFDSEFYA